MRPTTATAAFLLLVVLGLTACASVGFGISLPIGGLGGLSVGVNSDGRVSGGVTVGGGGVSVGVGGSAQLPPASSTPAKSRSAASAPASAASAASSPAT